MRHRFEKYCKDYENIENYEKAKADNFKGWNCHHRLETHNSDGEIREVDITRKELIALGMYYNRPASELIFMKHNEHSSLHKKGANNPNYGKHLSEETKKKISEAIKGEKHPMYNKKHSEETKKKLSAAKIGNTATKGMHWYNNGAENKLCFECPEGFVPGMLK